MKMASNGVLSSLLFLLFSAIVAIFNEVELAHAKVHSSENVGAVEGMKLVPLIDEETKMKMAAAVTNEAIRNLGSFQICAPCSCCSDGAEGHCLLSPCCYAIKCNLPHRPFGLCSFTPMTCNCFGCHP